MRYKGRKKRYVTNRLNREEYNIEKQHRKKEMRQIKKQKEKEIRYNNRGEWEKQMIEKERNDGERDKRHGREKEKRSKDRQQDRVKE